MTLRHPQLSAMTPPRRCVVLLTAGGLVAATAASASGPVDLNAQPAAGTLPGQMVSVGPIALSSCFSSDHGDPSLTSLTVRPRVLDLRDGGQIRIHAAASDTGGPGNPTGIDYFRVRLDPKDRDTDVPEYLYVTLLPDATGGWSGAATLPRTSTPGRWDVTWAKVADAARPWPNSREYLHSELVELGLARHLSVRSAKDGDDPKLLALALSQAEVDTRRSAKPLRVRARLRDVDSGVSKVWATAYHKRSDQYLDAALRRTTGTPRRGGWSGQLPFSRWNHGGAWNVSLVAIDRSGESRRWGTGKLRRLGFPTTVHVVSDRDEERPAVTAFTTEPSFVDLRDSDGQVTVRMSASDARSGIDKITVTLTSPSGLHVSGGLHLISGTAQAGAWEATMPLARCRSEAGTWSAVVEVTDQVGHDRRYEPASMNLSMQAGDHFTPKSQVSPRTPLAGPLVVTFDEDVQGVDATSMVVRRRTYPPSPPTAGAWSCSDATQATADCAAGPVRTARFVPSVPFAAKPYEVEINPMHVLGVTDLSGNPHFWEAAVEFRPG